MHNLAELLDRQGDQVATEPPESEINESDNESDDEIHRLEAMY